MTSFNRSTRNAMLLIVLASITLPATTTHAGIFERHRFDMEPVASLFTEPGWTHMDHTIAYVPGVSGGFDTANSVFYGSFDRGGSTMSPALVRRDLVIGRAAESPPSTTAVRVIFHDVAPIYATEATYTIYRDDPADSFPANFTTQVLYNGVLLNTHLGTGGFANYHTPITGVASWGGLPLVVGDLEFRFIDTTGINASSAIRIGGIDILYTPEPTAAIVAMGGAMLVACRRRRQNI